MIELYVLFTIAAIALIIGSYTDFKVREVPDWINYALIFSGLGLRLIFSMIYWDYTIILEGVFGFGIFFLIAVIMFYTGQWGGGDAKMLMGLGALLGVQLSLDTFILGFFLNTIMCGAVFGILFAGYLAILNRRKFARAFNRRFKEKAKMKWLIWGVVLMFLATSLFVDLLIKIPLIILAGLVFVSFYAFIFLKAVEDSCMIKAVSPEKLTEGDWIVKDVYVDKKKICGPKDLGIEMDQIKQLIAYKKKGKIDKVLVKNGIPFVPSFLLGFIVTLVWGNILFHLLGF